MNILIPDSWLREFIKTKATSKEIAHALSLCALSVERIFDYQGELVYEIEITPNRSDTLSVLGVAREAAAVLPQFEHRVEWLKKVKKDSPPRADYPFSASLNLDVEITDPKLCPHFAALVLDNIEIKPSPPKIQKYLEAAGIRSLNNVIDTTNYIMVETGQPLHAFDFDKLSGTDTSKKMVVRASKKGEKVTTLDQMERDLPEDTIIIDDGEKIIDLCGIMGGGNSDIDENTQRVILFSQVYDPIHIRKASMALGHRTEAALRFEKGLDPAMVVPALYKAAQMVVESGGKVASGLVEIRQKEFEPHTVALSREKLDRYLGITLELEQIGQILEALQLGPNMSKTGEIVCDIPSWRDKDLLIEEDLIEEVARIHGYYNLPTTLPSGQPPAEVLDKKFKVERRLKYLLKDLGFTEVYTNSMVSEDFVSEALKIRNPFSEEMAYMRTSLLPSLEKVVAKNKPRFSHIKIFEMANVYSPKEEMVLTAMWWNKEEGRESIRRKIIGTLEAILGELNTESTVPYQMGETHEGANIWYLSLSLKELVEAIKSARAFTPIATFTPIREDLSLVVGKKTRVGEMLEAARSTSELVANVKLGEDPLPLGENEKAVWLNIEYNSTEKQLTEQEVKPVREKIIKRLGKEFGAELRR